MLKSIQHLNGCCIRGIHSGLFKVIPDFAVAHQIPLDASITQFGLTHVLCAHTVVVITCQTHNSGVWFCGCAVLHRRRVTYFLKVVQPIEKVTFDGAASASPRKPCGLWLTPLVVQSSGSRWRAAPHRP
jgi:hypothetical protein